MNYQDVEPISREKAVKVFASEDTNEKCRALVSITFHDPDWEWVQDTCLDFLQDDDKDVQGLAITCLGHIARIHHKLDLNKIMPLLTTLKLHPELRSRVEDTLDDIEMFATRNPD